MDTLIERVVDAFRKIQELRQNLVIPQTAGQEPNEAAQEDDTRREDSKIMGVGDIQKQIGAIIRLVERLNTKATEYNRLCRGLSNTEPSVPEMQRAAETQKWWQSNAQPLVEGIRKQLEPLRSDIEAYWSGKYSWDSFCGMLDYGKDNYAEWKAKGWPEIHIQELQEASRALASAEQRLNRPRQGSESRGAQVNVNIQNSSNVTLGDLQQTQNLVSGNQSSVGKEMPTGRKSKKNVERVLTASVLFLAGLLTVLQILFGWIGDIWRFLTGK
jgi:hypothetical protein